MYEVSSSTSSTSSISGSHRIINPILRVDGVTIYMIPLHRRTNPTLYAYLSSSFATGRLLLWRFTLILPDRLYSVVLTPGSTISLSLSLFPLRSKVKGYEGGISANQLVSFAPFLRRRLPCLALPHHNTYLRYNYRSSLVTCAYMYELSSTLCASRSHAACHQYD